MSRIIFVLSDGQNSASTEFMKNAHSLTCEKRLSILKVVLLMISSVSEIFGVLELVYDSSYLLIAVLVFLSWFFVR